MVGIIFDDKKGKRKGNIFCLLSMKARVKSLLSTPIIISFLILLSFCNVMHSQYRIDTIGKTTYDLQFIGPSCKIVVDDSTTYEINGIHTVWLHSEESVPFSDLQMRYNYYDYYTHTWEFGQNGTTVLPINPNNSANLDVNPVTHCACVPGYKCSTFVARDMAPGAGIFELLRTSDTGYQYPLLAVGSGQRIHIAAYRKDSIFYGLRWGATWNNWRSLGYAGYPSHNICASKVSAKVCVLWTVVDSTRSDWGVLYIRTSIDGGNTWSEPIAISESIPSNLRNTFLGGYAMYDNNDNLHIVTQTYDGHNVKPVEMWHYCPANSPHWSSIAYLTTDTLLGKVGYGALYACRPNIWQSPLYPSRFAVVWEKFKWDDIDSTTGEKYLRGDVGYAYSFNYGSTWIQAGDLIASPGVNERFPVLIKTDFTLRVRTQLIYMIDNSAGIYVKGEGIKTCNPIVYKVFQGVGIEEDNFSQSNCIFDASPNPFSKSVSLTYNPYLRGKISVDIYDRDGRLIKALKENSNSERNIVLWNGKDAFGKIVSKGIYFCVVKAENMNITKKIVFVK